MKQRHSAGGENELSGEETIATLNRTAGFKSLPVSFHYKKEQSV